MAAATVVSRIARLFREVAHEVRSGHLLDQQPHNVDFCPCCDGDPWLRRCDVRYRYG